MSDATVTAMVDMLDNDCKLSMLWNWHTVNACFLSSRLRITSPVAFAFMCIGVVILVMSLESFRRLGRYYDKHVYAQPPNAVDPTTKGVSPLFTEGTKEEVDASPTSTSSITGFAPRRTIVRPTFAQQMVRSIIYTLQFAVAYLTMLLAMSHNGYVLISIFVGAFMGFAIFSWEGQPSRGDDGSQTCG